MIMGLWNNLIEGDGGCCTYNNIVEMVFKQSSYGRNQAIIYVDNNASAYLLEFQIFLNN